jgi:hypothetical protein
MNNLNVYITTCDANIFIVKYFQYFFNKYWGKHMNVKVLGFNKPNFELAENFEFISLGSEQVGGAKGWSNYLIDFFSSISDEHYIYGLDDFMIARPVDEEVYKTCLELLDEKTGRIDLQPSLQYARSSMHVKPYTEKNGIKFLSLVESGRGHNLYQNAAAFSIWNKKWFLKNIRRDWSPWDWEITGSMSLADGDGYNVIGSVDRWAVRKLEVLSSQWKDTINVRGIRTEDLEVMKTLSKSEDRVTKFEPVMDNKWYYEVPNGDWESTIFGK